ncbi:MAG: hypothetical protein AB1Z23_08645 [Eubacteriales bacterium]
MDFNFKEDFWKLILLALAAFMNYGADFIAGKITEDKKRHNTVKIGLKLGAFALAIFVAIAVVFL